ncbi:hypothetical protein E8E13_006616 [Curvularia kusanoi]|uniref:Uncharacterized protein n=1 Tax=Curvularia kusanoi TaxID=90978 RepID=A0A9P4TDN8_CURKU|nr:hypothetical protein E8E13_006616 [Curvularia kusanoi]
MHSIKPPCGESYDREEAEASAKLEGVLQKISQVLDQHSEANSETKAVSPLNTAQKETTLTDLDLVKILGGQMLELKRKNEEKLMEANEVLKYLRPTVEQNQRGDQVESESIRPDRAQHSYESLSETSNEIEQDSIAGNSSGSSVSSVAPEARRVRYSPEVGDHQFDRRMKPDTIDSEDDVTTTSTESDDETTVRRAKTESSNSEVGQRGIVTTSGHETTQSAAIVKTQLEMMGELIALRREISTLQQQTIKVEKPWFMQATSTLRAKLGIHFRPVPQPGTQRLEWTCECGEEMYADLPIQDRSQYQQMLEFLTRPGPRAHQANSDPTPSQLEGGTTQLNYALLQSSQSSSIQQLSPSSTFGSGSTFIGTDASQTLSPSQNIFSGQSKYLELCVNINKYETKLAEIQVLSGQANGAAICTDAHLFRQIYQQYYALRKHNWHRFLYRPAGIKFVHFGVQTGERVSFFSSDPLPPEDVITAKRYEYDLQPPVPPPIDSRTFLHYFYKHGAHSHSTSAKYVNRLPKKLGDSLTRSLGADDLLEGWGIHIIEGPNKVAICWALMAVLAASLAVSIVYDFLTRSGESGFAIGQWMVAALTVGLSALYFSLEDDVNTSFD